MSDLLYLIIELPSKELYKLHYLPLLRLVSLLPGYDITIHVLRHTYATNLLANGLDFKTVARLMGRDVEQTIKTYSYVTDDMIKRATRVINNVF